MISFFINGVENFKYHKKMKKFDRSASAGKSNMETNNQTIGKMHCHRYFPVYASTESTVVLHRTCRTTSQNPFAQLHQSVDLSTVF